ncbi:chitin-binding protein [Enterococcus villorum]|uniref:Chitin-binding protein n=1 Tax=Enterococcus villorum TaxID=112904 RepID=A0A1V8YR21_9ENTE|nr:lytic polysaccharide monooxygenase [Enterococcus villorum]OQO70786.1 chitin-binding protein [Enterococcus villorum]OQO75093.1 chitin-binding protein [Enterococcus villorum]
MKKSLLLGLGLVLATAGLTTFSSADVSAHGYVKSPISRAYQGNLDKSINEKAALLKYGPIIYEPQSLEAPKGFPEAGPADGKIASANEAKGPQLDAQTSTLWTKQNITTGPTNFTWYYTQSHKTAKWHYYITKNGWNQNKKLTRDDLQFIGEVKGSGIDAEKVPTQTITIPSDHIGYHVILAVWDIYDTSNVFYNVIDVNIQPRTALTDLSK